MFDNSEDRLILEKSIIGISDCATLAVAYDLSDVFDYIILSLAKVGGLVVNERFIRTTTYGSQNFQFSSSSNAVLMEFGRNLNQKLACILMFDLIFKYPAQLKEGWNHVYYNFV